MPIAEALFHVSVFASIAASLSRNKAASGACERDVGTVVFEN
jgi:hypothetical protein